MNMDGDLNRTSYKLRFILKRVDHVESLQDYVADARIQVS